MKKDMVILIGVLSGLALVMFILIYSGNQKDYNETIWIDKKSGDGPYELQSGSRKENRLETVGHVEGEIEILKTTSEHDVQFSAKEIEVDHQNFNETDTVPEVKY